MSSLNCRHRFSISVLETLTFEWQCSQYLELNPACGKVRSELNKFEEHVRLLDHGARGVRAGG